ncbi:MAG TPA: acetyl-CoA C-acetyltransferase [Chloroflexota bacterium]|nr:acetyl-CoA C-acetyltransferase [Chloroflexota bacterium]
MSGQPTLQDVVIAGAARTPVGRFMGGLSALSAPELGAVAIRAALERAGVEPQAVDGVIMGCVLPAGVGMAPARQAALKAGLPSSVPALTVNKVCGSGLIAVALAAQQIRLGEAEIVVAGGMESMSRAPHLLPGSRAGHKMGEVKLLDHMIQDGLWCAWADHHMGNSAEAIAARHGVTRQEQDAWSLRSHERALAAIRAGALREEIVPVEVLGRRGSTVVDTDECPRADTSAEALAALRPVFSKEGTVTAGSASQIADGGAALVVMSRRRAEALGVSPLARYVAQANVAVDPLWLFEAPVPTIEQLLEKTGTALQDYDLIELNEAYAAQVVADGKLLGWDAERVNVHGGAIALGHPLGCSGARLLTTLLYALRRRGGRRGIGAACLGGGEAYAIAVEAA